MSPGALRRVVEAFFRRWPFYLLLFIGATLLGLVNVSRSIDSYSSSGAMFVDGDSLVTTQSGVQDGGFFSFLTPAGFASQELNGLLTTDAFMEAVIEEAGVELSQEPASRSETIRQLRRSITSFSSSENLLEVAATTADPDLSMRLVQASMDQFVQFQISIDIAESGASEEFFTDLTTDLQDDVNETRRSVDNALRGVASLEELTPAQSRELDRLREAEVRAAERFREALNAVEASQLATLQAETDIRQTYSLFDPPQVPVSPNGGVIDDLMLLLIFMIVGAVLALIGPVLSALLNRTVMFPDDLEAGLGIGVMAVVPRIRRKALRIDEAVVSPDFPAATAPAAIPNLTMPVPQVPKTPSITGGTPAAQVPAASQIETPAVPAGDPVPVPVPDAAPEPAGQPAAKTGEPSAMPVTAEDEMSRAAWLAVTTTEFVTPKSKSNAAGPTDQPPLDFLEAMLADGKPTSDADADADDRSEPEDGASADSSGKGDDAASEADAETTAGTGTGGGDDDSSADSDAGETDTDTDADETEARPDTVVGPSDDDLMVADLGDGDELFDLSDLEFDPWASNGETSLSEDDEDSDDGDGSDDGFSITVPPASDEKGSSK